MTAEHPILFSGPLVRAILVGRKTQTRRVIRPQPPSVEAVREVAGAGFRIGRPWPKVAGRTWAVFGPVGDVGDLCGRVSWTCPYGQPGDLLWVRETHAFGHGPDYQAVVYRADGAEHRWVRGAVDPVPYDGPRRTDVSQWRPSIHMPRWASRLTLRVTGVRVERVQDTSEEDIRAEGLRRRQSSGPWAISGPCVVDLPGGREHHGPPRECWRLLWEGIYASRGLGWAANPWVWAIEFERVDADP